MNGPNFKKILSTTGVASIALSIGFLGIVDLIKKDFSTSIANVERKILQSTKNDYNLSAALITKNITSNSYEFRLGIVGTKNLKVLNRYVYEIVDGKSKSFFPIWNKELKAYTYTSNRDSKAKILVFAFDVEVNQGEIVTVVSNECVIYPSFKDAKIKLSSLNFSDRQTIESVYVEILNLDYEYSDLFKMDWQRKYDFNGVNYSSIENTLFDSEKVFNKEFCGKWIKVIASEVIKSPVGLFKNGNYQYDEFIVSDIESNEIYIKPGMFGEYKLNLEFLNKNTIRIKSEFRSKNNQNENNYLILGWETSTNDGNWISFTNNSKSLVDTISLNDKKEYRMLYSLKNGNENDKVYTNTILIEPIQNIVINKNNSKLVVSLPDFINPFNVYYEWYSSNKSTGGFVKLENENSHELIIGNDFVGSKYYKVILNYGEILNNFETPSIVVNNVLSHNLINIEHSSSIDNALTVKANVDFQGLNDFNTEYVWGQGDKILEEKTGNVVTFLRKETPVEYWVFASNKDVMTDKKYFTITEAFNPNLSFEKNNNKVHLFISNKNIDLSRVNYIWQKSIDGRTWNDDLTILGNTFDYSNDNCKFLRVKLLYKEEQDIMISNNIEL